MEMRRGSANPIRASGHKSPAKRSDTKLQPASPSQQIDPCLTGGVHTNVMLRHDPHVHGAWAVVSSGMRSPLRADARSFPSGFSGLAPSAWVFSFRSCLVSFFPPSDLPDSHISTRSRGVACAPMSVAHVPAVVSSEVAAGQMPGVFLRVFPASIGLGLPILFGFLLPTADLPAPGRVALHVPQSVAPAPEPGSIHGSRCRRSR